MSIEEIRSFRNAKPFRPFTLLMDSGQLVRVELPERLALSFRGDRLSVFEGTTLRMLEVGRIRHMTAEEPAQNSFPG
jgi:hypothetical protein